MLADDRISRKADKDRAIDYGKEIFDVARAGLKLGCDRIEDDLDQRAEYEDHRIDNDERYGAHHRQTCVDRQVRDLEQHEQRHNERCSQCA